MNKLRKIAFLSFLICLVIQLFVIIFYWDVSQISDWGSYMAIAKNCLLFKSWYPSADNLYDSYIWAPGFINWLILQLKFLGSFNYNMIFNLLMNIGITYEIYYLSKKFFNLRTSYISVILYSLIYSNWIIIAPAGTEIPFLFFALTAFCLSLSRHLWKVFFAGFFLIIANWIRPLIFIFIPSIFIWMYIQKRPAKFYVTFVLSMFCWVFILGITNRIRVGEFIYQSTTGGVNLIMAANDDAKIGINHAIFTDSTNIAFIENKEALTFKQKDLIYKQRAIEWILDNPVKYATMYVQKLFRLYISDSWPDYPLNGADSLSGGFISDIVKNGFTSVLFWRLVKSLIYYICLLFFVYALWVKRNDILSVKGIFLVMIFVGTVTTCIFPAATRYHYPFLFSIVIWAAYGVDHLFLKLKL